MALIRLPSTPESPWLVGAAPCSAPGLTLVLPEAPGRSPPQPVSRLPGANTSGVWNVCAWPQLQRQGVVCSCIRTSGCGVSPEGVRQTGGLGSRGRWLQAQPDPGPQSAVRALRTQPLPLVPHAGGSREEEASLRAAQTPRLGWAPLAPLPGCREKLLGMVWASQGTAPTGRGSSGSHPLLSEHSGGPEPWPWLVSAPALGQ